MSKIEGSALVALTVLAAFYGGFEHGRYVARQPREIPSLTWTAGQEHCGRQDAMHDEHGVYLGGYVDPAYLGWSR